MKNLTIRQVNDLHSAFRRLLPRVARRTNVDRTYVNRIIKGQRNNLKIKHLLIRETQKILNTLTHRNNS
jgi:hypothetical protein